MPDQADFGQPGGPRREYRLCSTVGAAVVDEYRLEGISARERCVDLASQRLDVPLLVADRDDH
jgi:hypothetical protein